MTSIAHARVPQHEEAARALTAGKLAILVPLALALWALAWSIIHFRGPVGAFVGVKGAILYAFTILLTIPINWLHLKLASLPKSEIVNAVAVTLAVATTIDGVCIGFFPQVYSVDDTTLRHGAAWLLWAGAVACYLAFRTRRAALRESAAADAA